MNDAKNYVFNLKENDPKFESIFKHKSKESIRSGLDYLNNITSIEIHSYPRQVTLIDGVPKSVRYGFIAEKYGLTFNTVRRTVKHILEVLDVTLEDMGVIIPPPKKTIENIIELKRTILMKYIRETILDLSVDSLREMVLFINSICEYAKGWKNKEGWLVINDKLVCADWDAYCTKCRVDDSQDYVIGIRSDPVGIDKNV